MSKKRETVWRDKLVKLFRERNQRGFIWVNGSLFKQGFPDLTMIQDGVTTFVELKVATDKVNLFLGLSQRQKLVCQEIVKAGGRAYCLELVPSLELVRSWNFYTNMAKSHPQKEFELAIWGWLVGF